MSEMGSDNLYNAPPHPRLPLPIYAHALIPLGDYFNSKIAYIYPLANYIQLAYSPWSANIFGAVIRIINHGTPSVSTCDSLPGILLACHSSKISMSTVKSLCNVSMSVYQIITTTCYISIYQLANNKIQ